jgi:hypothetical protein
VPVTRGPANATRPRYHTSHAPDCWRNRIHAYSALGDGSARPGWFRR